VIRRGTPADKRCPVQTRAKRLPQRVQTALSPGEEKVYTRPRRIVSSLSAGKALQMRHDLQRSRHPAGKKAGIEGPHPPVSPLIRSAMIHSSPGGEVL